MQKVDLAVGQVEIEFIGMPCKTVEDYKKILNELIEVLNLQIQLKSKLTENKVIKFMPANAKQILIAPHAADVVLYRSLIDGFKSSMGEGIPSEEKIHKGTSPV